MTDGICHSIIVIRCYKVRRMGGDRIKRAEAGPDAMFATDLPPSRGQHETIAALAGQLLGFDPNSRYDASLAIVRLRMALAERPARDPLPDAPAF
jgi:hypothetical protein